MSLAVIKMVVARQSADVGCVGMTAENAGRSGECTVERHLVAVFQGPCEERLSGAVTPSLCDRTCGNRDLGCVDGCHPEHGPNRPIISV